jgi:endonuclease/exonuclease/phosphatase family metal-dependent hydrolase
MVVGDFNRTYQSGDPFWGAFTGMAIPTANHQPACNGGRYAEHIDHVAASPGILLGPVVEVTYDGTPTPSDHCPLVVKVGKGHE